MLFIYLYILSSTGCRTKALRNARFSDIKKKDGQAILSLYESKTNTTFVRNIDMNIYDELMKIQKIRKSTRDDDPDRNF